jgi:hypothetical protein
MGTPLSISPISIIGGPEETRTPYLLIANEAFNQLNFRPAPLREIPQ